MLVRVIASSMKRVAGFSAMSDMFSTEFKLSLTMLLPMSVLQVLNFWLCRG